jgi:hypothetical protein
MPPPVLTIPDTEEWLGLAAPLHQMKRPINHVLAVVGKSLEEVAPFPGNYGVMFLPTFEKDDSRVAGMNSNWIYCGADLVSKEAALQLAIGGKEVTIGGMCKGSGMIHPNMATMLGVVTCDADVEPGVWRSMLRAATDASFNAVRLKKLGMRQTLNTGGNAPGRSACCFEHPVLQARFCHIEPCKGTLVILVFCDTYLPRKASRGMAK